MPSTSPLAEAIESLNRAGQAWLDGFGAHAQEVATRVGSPTYTANAAANDASRAWLWWLKGMATTSANVVGAIAYMSEGMTDYHETTVDVGVDSVERRLTMQNETPHTVVFGHVPGAVVRLVPNYFAPGLDAASGETRLAPDERWVRVRTYPGSAAVSWEFDILVEKLDATGVVTSSVVRTGFAV
jgi:hypothetical protein